MAGGVPVISGLQEGLAGDELFKICGILNGTCNYILSQIESNGVPFATALREAQKLGFAEADPTEDIEGLDARAKLAILARVDCTATSRPPTSWLAPFRQSTRWILSMRTSWAAPSARFPGPN